MANGDKPRLSVAKCPGAPSVQVQRPSRAEAEEAVRTLIRWAGDDPAARRAEGHAGTRVARAFEDWFSGYASDPRGLSRAHLRGSARL